MDLLRQASWACAELIEIIDRHHEVAAWRLLERYCLTSGRKYDLDLARSWDVEDTVSGVHDRTEGFQSAEAEETGEVFSLAFHDRCLQRVESSFPVGMRDRDRAAHLIPALLRTVPHATYVEGNRHLLLGRSVAVAEGAFCKLPRQLCSH
jgi:hypothetical protein